MDVSAYVERIDDCGSLACTAETLRRLHAAHLAAVPFENLSVLAGEPVVLDDEALFEKVVTRRRGGFCYELNGLFAALLRALGFDVAMLSAGVMNSARSEFGPDFDHMALLVTLEERWLVDVGFGDAFREPLRLEERGVQVQEERAFRIDPAGDRLALSQREDHDNWRSLYRFDLQPRAYADYAGMCRHHQTSPHSPFTQRRICQRAAPEGRVWLNGTRLVTYHDGERRERELGEEREVVEALREHFGIDPPPTGLRASR